MARIRASTAAVLVLVLAALAALAGAALLSDKPMIRRATPMPSYEPEEDDAPWVGMPSVPKARKTRAPKTRAPVAAPQPAPEPEEEEDDDDEPASEPVAANAMIFDDDYLGVNYAPV